MKCRVCGCTDEDCTRCIQRTGSPCTWAKPDLCSACVSPAPAEPQRARRRLATLRTRLRRSR